MAPLVDLYLEKTAVGITKETSGKTYQNMNTFEQLLNPLFFHFTLTDHRIAFTLERIDLSFQF